MSIAKKCDRCGKYYDGRIYKINIETPTFDDFDEDYDICRDCKAEFNKFMESGKDTTEKPKGSLQDLIKTAKYALLNAERREKHNSKG